jgi:cytochrome c551/c552
MAVNLTTEETNALLSIAKKIIMEKDRRQLDKDSKQLDKNKKSK